jgi:translation elongation factor P/translation initiation factor 5A
VQAIKENNILRMYVDETVLNFMNHREFETSLMANETVEATVRIHRYLQRLLLSAKMHRLISW